MTIHSKVKLFFDRVIRRYEGMPDGYFSFTFVRNPYERCYSFYRNKVLLNWDEGMGPYLKQCGIYPKMTMLECLKRITDLDHKKMDAHFAPQYLLVFDKHGNSMVNFIGKIETFSHDWEVIEDYCGFPVPVTKANVTKDKIELDVSQKVNEMIYSIYQKDFNMLGYKK